VRRNAMPWGYAPRSRESTPETRHEASQTPRRWHWRLPARVSWQRSSSGSPTRRCATHRREAPVLHASPRGSRRCGDRWPCPTSLVGGLPSALPCRWSAQRSGALRSSTSTRRTSCGIRAMPVSAARAVLPTARRARKNAASMPILRCRASHAARVIPARGGPISPATTRPTAPEKCAACSSMRMAHSSALLASRRARQPRRMAHGWSCALPARALARAARARRCPT
jgi:hypothetical protein